MIMIPFIMMIPKTKKKTTIHRRSLGFFSFQRFKGGCHLAPIPENSISCGSLKNMNDLFKMIGKATIFFGWIRMIHVNFDPYGFWRKRQAFIQSEWVGCNFLLEILATLGIYPVGRSCVLLRVLPLLAGFYGDFQGVVFVFSDYPHLW